MPWLWLLKDMIPALAVLLAVQGLAISLRAVTGLRKPLDAA
jgi:TRAP-type mannitol/chloroaromatic compound transport system permease small subunit